jgi:zinc D-Ala-D-Ala carboxypeptidase
MVLEEVPSPETGMRLSPNFTLDEFVVSQTAARLGLDNTPPPEIMPALLKTAQGMEAVRVRLSHAPIAVSSGYRSQAVNKAVGGSASSQHTKGEAVDFICPRFGTPAEVVDAIKGSGIEFDQLILEFDRWVHISFTSQPRHMVLTIDAKGTRPYGG